MPVIFKILASLTLILAVQRLSKKLLPAVAAGTLLLAFWAGHTLKSFFGVIADSFFSRGSLDNYMLLLIIFLVIWLSDQMSKTGVMKELVGAVNGVFSKRTSMAVLPALIGLLPMPGGALFSAPLVDDCDDGKEIEPLLKTKINFWFRHIWEYWWPLYPGVILAMDITGLDPLVYIAAFFPLTLFSLITGFVFILRKVKKDKKDGPRDMRNLLVPVIPIVVLIIVYILVQILFPGIKAAGKYFPMCIGIIAAIICQQIMRPLRGKDWFGIVFSRKALVMAVIVAVIRIYGIFIEAQVPGGGYLIEELRSEMAAWGIPPLFLIVLLPFVASLTCGIAVGYVGASLPIVMQLTGSNPSTGLLLSTAVLAYGSGYIALLLSPVHVCLIVTNEHFNTSLLASIRRMLVPAMVLFSMICLWSFLLWVVF